MVYEHVELKIVGWNKLDGYGNILNYFDSHPQQVLFLPYLLWPLPLINLAFFPFTSLFVVGAILINAITYIGFN